MKKSRNTLLVRSSTWNKESTELLDYESQDLIKANFTTKTESYLIRQANNVRLIPSLQQKESNAGLLLKLSFDVNNFYLSCNEAKRDEKDKNSSINWGEVSWFIVKMLKNSEGEMGYKLNPGDMIKLGRIKLRICDIKLPGYEENQVNNSNLNDKCIENNNNNNNENAIEKENNMNIEMKNRTSSNLKNFIVNVNDELTNKVKRETEKSNYPNTEKAIKETNQLNNSDRKRSMCRICYCSEKELDSPLIRPCNCSGTMKYIHFCCLQKWLKSKIVVKTSSNESTITYSFKLVECELCKTLLPDFIKYKNKLYEIWDFTKPTFKHYISFETITADRNNKILYIVNLEKKSSLKIGRGHDSDVRITDISVSRFHSQIKKTKDGKLILEDNNSKFGTLALVQNLKLSVLLDNPLSIQIGRTILNFNIKLPCSLFGCLFRKSNKNKKDNDYQILNQKYISKQNHNNIKVQNEEEESEYSFTEHLETEKEKELRNQNNVITIAQDNQNNIENAQINHLEESKQMEIELTQSHNINMLVNNNNLVNNLNRNPLDHNSNIIIIEQDESREIRLRESEIFNKILDPNLKTERDNEKQIIEIIQDRKKEAELEREIENNLNGNIENNDCPIEKILIPDDNNKVNEIQCEKKVSKRIKEEIDLKILDLKNLNNLIMKNKLDEVESVKKTITIKKKNIKKSKKDPISSIENTDENVLNSQKDEEAKASEEVGEIIVDRNLKEKLTLSDIQLVNASRPSGKLVLGNSENENKMNNAENLKQKINEDVNNFDENLNDVNYSKSNLNNFLCNHNSLITNNHTTNNNNVYSNANSDLSPQSKNINHIKIEHKKTGDFTAMNSYINNYNNNLNSPNTNLININNNNYLVNNETDNELVFNNDNLNIQNNNLILIKKDEENEYNSKNLVLNAVININEIDNFALNYESNKERNDAYHHNCPRSAGVKSFSDKIHVMDFGSPKGYEKESLNSMENIRKINCGTNKYLFESRAESQIKNAIKVLDIQLEPIKAAYLNIIPKPINDLNESKEEKDLNLHQDQDKFYNEDITESPNANVVLKSKDSTLSAKSNTSNKKLKRHTKEDLDKISTPKNLNQKKSFMEDLEFLDNKHNNDNYYGNNFKSNFNTQDLISQSNSNNNNLKDDVDNNKCNGIIKSVNSEDEVINKKNHFLVDTRTNEDSYKIKHYSENLSNVLEKIKKDEFNNGDEN